TPSYNITTETFDDLLQLCWPRQECSSCLDQAPCSWCPSSSTCVPNTFKIPILAPIHSPDICPLWSERWELRTRPFGCHVSTITFFTCIISVLATFLAVGFIVVGFKVGWRIQANWKTRSEGWWKVWSRYQPGWWRGWRLKLVDIKDAEAERPLLSHG
ncbi:hypothetical protein LOCC1_G006290, partial [Lachnellula occidentalis]